MSENERKIKIKYLVIGVFLTLLIVLGSFFLYQYILKMDSESAKEYISDNLVNENGKFDIVSNDKTNIDQGDSFNKEEIEESSNETNILYESERINKVKELQKQNSDIVGWLEIVDTDISYPILQGIDNDYYMTHNYKKRKSKNGSLFLDKDYNWDKPSTNLLIYGHNNRGTNEMFVELLKYKDEEFYKEHPIIRFTTEKEDAIYEIISTFLSRVYYKREKDVFRYYYFIDANNEEEYDYYVSESKKASLYNIDATAKYGEQLITLSTCDFSREDGRFVVVARKQDN